MKVSVSWACAFLTLCSVSGSSQTPRPEVIDLAQSYVQRFLNGFSNVVAEELYRQEATSQRRSRTLRSDFVLVRYPENQWHVFRGVFEVDGRQVSGYREGGLQGLFNDPSESAVRRAQEIASASLQHNVHDIGTINNPLLAMSFLQGATRGRFRFTPSDLEQSLGPSVRRVQFEETHTPTILRLGGNRDLPASGWIWVDESTGKIVKTELRVGRRELVRGSRMWRPPSIVTTVFGFDEVLAIDVPVEMRDEYSLDDVDIKGVATYRRFRRFDVGKGV